MAVSRDEMVWSPTCERLELAGLEKEQCSLRQLFVCFHNVRNTSAIFCGVKYMYKVGS